MHHLVGVTEIAQMLGVTRQRVHKITQTDSTFPEPDAILSAGHIWKRAEVEAWARRTGRLPAEGARQPGRGQR